MTLTQTIGFAPDEIDTSLSTRSARLKWVVVVDETLPAGRAANAAICAAAATSAGVSGLLGPDAVDAAGGVHPGLPWAGCSVLGGSPEQLAALRDKAGRSEGVFVADMPRAAQLTRVYDEYLGEMAGAQEPGYLAVSIVGPRNRVDKLAKGLTLLP
ncbi:DUF2000 domain-containing protein [Frondihabitans australicus]|uniref:Uncharacterized protein DUF2000 n=1 Tax=Frondihabitans australicus TaxID=386892 RepID=A0A495IGS9_9MICO|nr:DUF2000 domain-containing protein [Frondihabitans australicus]RKR75164.1 uncharacterized protein DUF2000 [Frondihabitans australicus]